MYACAPLPTDSGDAPPVTRPASAAALGSYTQIVAGFVHTCGLASDGLAYCWGNNDYSQLGTDAASHSCGGRPCNKTPVQVRGARFTTIAAGWVHNCGIATDRATYCWGGGATGKAGYLGDGTLSRSATPVRVLADSAFVALAIGDGHACALTETGMAFCWGDNAFGQLGDGSSESRSRPVAASTTLRFRSIAAGAYHTCGITSANEAYCWGDNRWGQLGAGDVGYNSVSSARRTPTRVAGNLHFGAIVAGWEHTCAIATDGPTYCWGRNESARQLGDDSDATHRGVPSRIAGSLRFADLAAGALSTCGRTDAGQLYCWGANYHGTLGNGQQSTEGVGHPVATAGGPFADVALGQSHACALTVDRRPWCWGDQSAGQF